MLVIERFELECFIRFVFDIGVFLFEFRDFIRLIGGSNSLVFLWIRNMCRFKLVNRLNFILY